MKTSVKNFDLAVGP